MPSSKKGILISKGRRVLLVLNASLAQRCRNITTASIPTPTTTATPPFSLGRFLWRMYTENLDRRPLFTKASMAAVIFFCSDTATQFVIGNGSGSSNEGTTTSNNNKDGRIASFRWNASRACSGAGFGVIATFWLHYWWNFLEVAVGARIPMKRYRLTNTITKVVIDQCIGAPLYIYSYYVLTNFLGQVTAAALSSSKRSTSLTELSAVVLKSWEENNAKAREMLWPTMLQHWKVWPVVHTVNFYFTPLHHRVLVQNTVLVGWSGYLSYLNHLQTTNIMTPVEEIKATIVRRETERQLLQEEISKQHIQSTILRRETERQLLLQELRKEQQQHHHHHHRGDDQQQQKKRETASSSSSTTTSTTGVRQQHRHHLKPRETTTVRLQAEPVLLRPNEPTKKNEIIAPSSRRQSNSNSAEAIVAPDKQHTASTKAV